MSSWASTILIKFIIVSVNFNIHLLWSYLRICQNCPLGQFIWHLIYWKSLFLEIIVFAAVAFTWLLIYYSWKKQIKLSMLLIKVLIWFYSRKSLFIFTTHNSFRSAIYFSKRFYLLPIILEEFYTFLKINKLLFKWIIKDYLGPYSLQHVVTPLKAHLLPFHEKSYNNYSTSCVSCITMNQNSIFLVIIQSFVNKIDCFN